MPEQISSLNIFVYNNSQAFPVENAEVSIFDPQANQQVFSGNSDAEGKLPPVFLSTPPLEYSLSPNLGQPFSEWNVSAVFPNGNVTQVFNIQLYPETDAILNIINQN